MQAAVPTTVIQSYMGQMLHRIALCKAASRQAAGPSVVLLTVRLCLQESGTVKGRDQGEVRGHCGGGSSCLNG
jgi:hypothetical protein